MPECRLYREVQRAIVECYPEDNYEVEFTNQDGETIALCALSSKQFIVAWKANTKQWLSVSERVTSLTPYLPEESQQEVLDFARFLYQR